MSERIAVIVQSDDPISEAGLAAELRRQTQLLVLEDGRPEAAEVAVVITDEVDEDAVRRVRSLRRLGPKVVVVATRLDDNGLVIAAEAGACGLLRRSEARPARLLDAVLTAAAGDGTCPTCSAGSSTR